MTKRPLRDDFFSVISADGHIPQRFRLRDRVYVVTQVLMTWQESGAWWTALSTRFASGEFADVDATDVVWHITRLHATSAAGDVVLDVALRDSLTSSVAEPWRLLRVVD